VVSLPYARVRLCEEHFEKYMLKRIKKVKLPDRLLVGLSGGKDSIVMTYLLRRAGVDMVTLTVNTVPKYTEIESKIAESFSKELGIPHLTVHARELYGFTALSYKQLKRTPCGLCSTLRRHALDLIGRRLGFEYVATGHNLDDMLQVALTSMMFGSLRNLRKIKPVEPKIKGSLGRVKPLFWVPERDILAFALTKKLPWLKVRCPLYEVGSTHADVIRNFMHDLENLKPSVKLKTMKNIVTIADSIKMKENEIGVCRYCGLASYSEICSVCKLRMRVKSMKTVEKDRYPRIDVYNNDGNIPVIGHGWVKWIRVDAKSMKIEKVLEKVGLNKEKAVVVDRDGRPLSHDSKIYGEVGKGDLQIYVVTRVSPRSLRSFVP